MMPGIAKKADFDTEPVSGLMPARAIRAATVVAFLKLPVVATLSSSRRRYIDGLPAPARKPIDTRRSLGSRGGADMMPKGERAA